MKLRKYAFDIRTLVPFVFLFFVGVFDGSAENMRRITVQDGLSGSAVTSICQSDDGLVWVGTLDGIDVLFGGRPFRPSTGKFFEGEIVEQMVATAPLDMWIQTTHNLYKIDRLNTEGDKLEAYPQFVGAHTVRRVSEDRGAVLDAQSRLHLYNPSNQSFELLNLPLKPEEQVVDFGGTEEFMWIMGKSGVYRCSWIDDGRGGFLLDGTVTLMDGPVKFCATTGNPEVINVLDERNRLYLFDIRQNTKTFILRLDDEVNFRGQPSGIVEMNGTYYISFKTNGVVKCAFDRELNSWTQSSLAVSSGVFQMRKDRYQDLVWVATDGDGLFAIWEGPYSFQSYLLNDFGHDFGKPVRSFFVDEKQWLWIGMKGGGLLGLDRSDIGKNVFECERRLFTSSDSQLTDNSVYALSGSRHGGFWVGTDAGLNFFRYSDRSLQPVSGCEGIVYVHSIMEIGESKLMISTVGAGVFEARVVRSGGRIRLEDVVHYDIENGNMASNYFFAMNSAPDGEVWFGNRGLGVFRMGEGGLEPVDMPYAENSFLVNDVFALQEFNDVMWIGTGGGLVGMGADGKDYYIGKNEGLPNNIIHSLLVDDADGLWIASNKGLARLDTSYTNIERYGRNNGLLVTEFCDGAVYRAEDRLYFGGFDGWVEVSRNKNYKSSENFAAPLYFVNLKSSKDTFVLLDDAYVYKSSGNGLKEGPRVELGQDENNFKVQFVAMDHLSPDNYCYLYKLDSDEEGQWIDNGLQNSISLSHLPYGDYSLHLKYINMTTGAESDPISMSITIAPYWWQTGLMKCLYWILLLAALAGGAIIAYRRMKLRHKDNLNAMEQQHKEELYEEKLRFFTNITHEFCTPLTLIYSPCDRILAHEDTNEFVRKYVKLIKKNASRLNELIQEVIDYRRIETKHQQLYVQHCDLSSFMKEACELFTDLAEKNGITFIQEIEPGIYWNMDMRCIPNIVSNLLSNAVKYTPQGGTVKVSFAKLPEDQIEIRVYNTGMGIKEEDRRRIFNRYYILDNVEERSAAGLARNGLGMAICHSSVKLLGGTIGINSEVGEYAEFVVTLPLLPLSEENEQTANDIIPLSLQKVELVKSLKTDRAADEILNAGPSGNHAADKDVSGILVVDDNVDVLFLLKEVLSHSYRVEVARNVDEALESLRTSMPQLIIADVMMPGKDGMHLVRQVKQNKHTMHIPVVMLSARNTADDMTEGVQIGADAYIGKPFNVKYLLAMVERMIESRKDMRQYYNSSASAYNYVKGQLLKKEDKDFLYKLEEFIEGHLSDSMLDAEAVADAMSLSVRSLYRKLKDLNQPSPNVYIKERRMEKVVNLLKTSDLSIQEIIYECGFNNRAHFYKDFGQRYGMTPKEFRQRQKTSEDTLGEE